MDATLGYTQVEYLLPSIVLDLKKELVDDHPTLNKYELDAFIEQVVRMKVRAILCTINSTAYEDIVKVVRDKLNLNDLFDNRQKYLN
jgi:hypothetical protein